jgi:hypothetical protein
MTTSAGGRKMLAAFVLRPAQRYVSRGDAASIVWIAISTSLDQIPGSNRRKHWMLQIRQNQFGCSKFAQEGPIF